MLTEWQKINFCDKKDKTREKWDNWSSEWMHWSAPRSFFPRLSYCENQARLLWWGRLAQRNMVVDKNKKNNATFNLLSSMEKPGSKGGELSFRHCVAASTAAAAAASTAYLTRLQTIIFLWQAFKWLRYIAQRLLMTFQDILFSNLCSQRCHPKVKADKKLDWEHLWYYIYIW